MPESDRPPCTCGPRDVITACTLGLFFIMVIAEIGVGIFYQNDCPRQPFISVYFYGFLFIVILPCMPSWQRFTLVLCPLAGLFLLGWFIAGNVLIYSIYEPNYNKNTTDVDPYCNKTLYLFTFWGMNFTYVGLVVLICSWYCCKKKEPESQPLQP